MSRSRYGSLVRFASMVIGLIFRTRTCVALFREALRRPLRRSPGHLFGVLATYEDEVSGIYQQPTKLVDEQNSKKLL